VIYASWPKPQQVRAQRTLRLEMAKAGVWNFNQGGIRHFIDDLKRGKAEHIVGFLNKNVLTEAAREERAELEYADHAIW
jgi:hypothetical protein